MSSIAVIERGPDAARLLAHVVLSGLLASTESGSDSAGSTLMQQIARTLAPLAAGGAWPGQNTSEPPIYPYITFFRVIRSNNLTFDGPSDLQGSRVQIDVIGQRYSDASAVAQAVREQMLRLFVIGAIDDQDFPPDPDVQAFRCSSDYMVWAFDGLSQTAGGGLAPAPAPGPAPTPAPTPNPGGSNRLSYVASVQLSGHIVVAIAGSGAAVPASADTAAHAITSVGVTDGAVIAGDLVTVCAEGGTIENSGWSFVADSPVFVGLAGALVQTVPSSALFVKVMGRALSPTRVLVEPQPAVFLAS